MTATIILSNTNINSGADVDMGGVTFTIGLKKNVQSSPMSGQLSTGSAEFNINRSQQAGVENPVLTIRGILDIHDFATDDALWTTASITEVNLGFLYALWRDATGDTTLTLRYGEPSDQRLHRNYLGTATNIPVIVNSMDIIPRADSEGQHMIGYNITLQETR